MLEIYYNFMFYINLIVALFVQVDLSSLKYYFVDDPGDVRVSPISDELKIALNRVVNSITSITELPPLKVKLRGVRYSYSLWRHWMTREEDSDFAATLGNQQVLRSRNIQENN